MTLYNNGKTIKKIQTQQIIKRFMLRSASVAFTNARNNLRLVTAKQDYSKIYSVGHFTKDMGVNHVKQNPTQFIDGFDVNIASRPTIEKLQALNNNIQGCDLGNYTTLENTQNYRFYDSSKINALETHYVIVEYDPKKNECTLRGTLTSSDGFNILQNGIVIPIQNISLYVKNNEEQFIRFFRDRILVDPIFLQQFPHLSKLLHKNRYKIQGELDKNLPVRNKWVPFVFPNNNDKTII